MRSDNQPPATGPQRSYATPLIVLGVAAAQVAIVYVLLAVDTPVSAFARHAAETWSGRLLLAGIGWGVISVTMIGLLAGVERRQRSKQKPDAG